MNKTKILTTTIIIILLAAGILYGVRMSVKNPAEPSITVEPGSEITSVTANYISETGAETIVKYNSNNTATLVLLNDEVKNIQLNIAMSGSGARYENTDFGLVVWEKTPEVTVYQNDQPIFSGRKSDVVAQEQSLKTLISYVWVWDKTLNGTGPDASKGEIIVPKKLDKFSLHFTLDGKVSGTTDCNSFSGTYSLAGNQITFGPFMSTLMACENSQETEFISFIKNGNIIISNNESMILENDTTSYFKKSE